MITTATTPSDLIIAINSTIRTKVTPNSITPETHSDLLDNIVGVLSSDTYTNLATYNASASTINFTTTNSGVTYSVSGITDTYTTGGTYTLSSSTITFEDNKGLGYSVSGITSGGGDFTGNTSGDCISDIYVSNLHSCSPLNILTGDKLLATFTELDGFKLEDNVNMVIPNNSKIVDELGDELLTNSKTIDRINESGISAESTKYWSVGSSIYSENVSGSLSAKTPTTNFVTTHDIVSGIIKNEINGAGLLIESVESLAESVEYVRSIHISGDTGNTVTSTKTNGVNELKEYVKEELIESSIDGVESGLKEVKLLKESSVDTINEFYVAGNESNVVGVNEKVEYSPIKETFIKSEFINGSVNGVEALKETIVELKSDYVESVESLYLNGDRNSGVKLSVIESSNIGSDLIEYSVGISGTSSATTATTAFETTHNILNGTIVQDFTNPTHPIEKVVTLLTKTDDGMSSTISGTSSATTATTAFETTHNILNGTIVQDFTNPTHPIEKVVTLLTKTDDGMSSTISGTSSATTATTAFETTHNILNGYVEYKVNGVETLVIGEGSLKYTDGNQLEGYVLTSDNNGLANWRPSSGATSPWSAGTGTNSAVLANSSNIASGLGSVAEGGYNAGSKFEIIATSATANSAHAEGAGTLASGFASHAEGSDTTASGNNSHSEGSRSVASGHTSHAEGEWSVAGGKASHAEGIATTASGDWSHVEGNGNFASGKASHAEGGIDNKGQLSPTSATTDASHAEGAGTLASGAASHAEGGDTVASSAFAHAEGSGTVASGDHSHAEGSNTVASATNSHAQNSTTTASGQASHAGGASTLASGDISFIHSFNSSVTGDRSVVLGGSNITGSTDDTVYVPKIEISEIGGGVIMKSPNGTRYNLTVNNSGVLSVTIVE